MYCRYCGKELPSDSKYCPNCGKEQGSIADSPLKWNAFAVLKRHRKVWYVYIGWFLIHISLFIFSDKHYYKYDGCKVDYFYPFGHELNEVLTDFPYVDFSLFKYCDAYDASELFFYTILFPLFILGIISDAIF